MNEPKRITVKEFREVGLLQELNRQFLHPLGMALEVLVEEDGTERFGGVWDYRDDPEGMAYRFPADCAERFREAAERVEALRLQHEKARIERYGAVVQPVDACCGESDR